MATSPKSASKLLFATALEALFPNYCYLCGLRSDREQPLCTDCHFNLLANKHCCSRCALPFSPSLHGLSSPLSPDTAANPYVCGRCLQSPPDFDRVLAPWLYDEQMAFLLRRWKFHGERRLSSLFAHLWLSQQNRDLSPPDLIVPTPLHWSKLWRRGFNQSELLAIELRRQCRELKGVKLDTRLIQRHRATAAQSTLAAAQRKSNMRGAFTARQRCDNLRVAIVDDVLTTGATAAAIATTLRDAGAGTIEVWCMARTAEPEN